MSNITIKKETNGYKVTMAGYGTIHHVPIGLIEEFRDAATLVIEEDLQASMGDMFEDDGDCDGCKI